MADRIPCCVPFCRRTAAAEKHPDSAEIICGKCWKGISAQTKAARLRLRIRGRRVGRLLLRQSILQRADINVKIDRMQETFDRLRARNWQQCKAEAIESAAGVS